MSTTSIRMDDAVLDEEVDHCPRQVVVIEQTAHDTIDRAIHQTHKVNEEIVLGLGDTHIFRGILLVFVCLHEGLHASRCIDVKVFQREVVRHNEVGTIGQGDGGTVDLIGRTEYHLVIHEVQWLR